MEIRPGTIPLDTDGCPLNAHGAGVLYHGGRYYLYGECRPQGGPELNARHGISCYSSPDFVEWTSHGVVLPVDPEGSGTPLEAGCKMERPKVLFEPASGQFVMWWHHDLKGWGHRGAYAGTAVASRPEGPFRFCEVFHPAGCMFRDCTLFQDDDESSYAIFATDDNANLGICRLDSAGLKPVGPCSRFFPGRYMEAPCVFKREGIYYLIASDCSGWYPNEARSAWAPSILGPWKEMGNPCLGRDAEITFGAQSTFVVTLHHGCGEYVFLADRWNTQDLSRSTYVWLPLEFRTTVPHDPPRPFVSWQESWTPRL